MNIIELADPVDTEVVTTYEFPEGYRPQVVELYAAKFPNYLVSKIIIRESVERDGSPWHRVELIGKSMTKDGVVRNNAVPTMILVAREVEDHVYQQHLAKKAGA